MLTQEGPTFVLRHPVYMARSYHLTIRENPALGRKMIWIRLRELFSICGCYKAKEQEVHC